MKRQMISAIVLGMAFSTAASAATLFYDFGDSSRTTAGNYNNIVMNAPSVLSIADSVDSTGANTGISLDASGFFAGSNQSGPGVASGDAAAIFETDATVDNAFGHAGAFGTNPLTPLATVTMGGLDGSGATSYDFTFFGSRTGATDNRETQFALAGANSGVGYLDVTANVSEVVNVSGIIPTAGGTITLEVSPGPNNNNGSLFYYLGAMRVVSNTIPEPATIGLLAFAGLAFTLQRRGRS
ncbi:PEP-CTERM sorting domain-containing protein [Bythopirellula goksoeyrii]|nr:PEP-CTERM sorting domain-containing protein [Bythopirellula goksoeyrii]